jgi:hypothetical protein
VTSWLDDAARRLAAAEDRGMTRARALRLAAGFGLAVGTASALGPTIDDARADDYCFKPCLDAADNDLSRKIDDGNGLILKSYVTTALAPLRLGLLAGFGVGTVYDYGSYYADRAQCRQRNCGDPKKYPPPQPPKPPPPPPPPPPGGTDYCTVCASVGGYCLPCATGSTDGFQCCSQPATPDDPNPCCPKT